MRNNISIDEVSLFFIVDDNLVEELVFLKEKIRVPETDTSGRFCRQHVQPPTPADDCESTHSILAPILQMAHLVNLCFAYRVLWQIDLIIYDIKCISLSVYGDLRDMRRTSPWLSPSSASMTSKSTSSFWSPHI